MGRVACGFEASWQVAADGERHRRVAADDVAHAAAETDGICRDDALVVALVGEDDAVVVAFAFGEVEGAEVDPCASAHLLVDAELCGDAAVLDGIVGVRDAAGHGLVGDVDCVVVLDEHFRYPDDFACRAFVRGGFCDAERAFAEGVVSVLVAFIGVCEAYAAVLPVVGADAFLVAAAVQDGIVVDDDFLLLPVAFPRGEDDGSGVLEHGDEIRHDEGLRELVLGGAEEPGPLPDPFLLVGVVVFAVAVADAEVASLQAFLDGVGAAHRCDPRVAFVEFAPVDAGGVGAVHHAGRDELFDGRLSGADGQVVGVVGHGQEAFHLGIEVAHDEGGERLCDEVVAQHDGGVLCRGVCDDVLHLDFAQVGEVGVLVVFEVLSEVLRARVVACGKGLQAGCECEHQEG